MQDRIVLCAYPQSGAVSSRAARPDDPRPFQSPECQRADWTFHKGVCKANREYRKAMAAQDELEMIESYVQGTRPRPTSVEVNAEMGEFLRRFRAVICRASHRCFGVNRGNKDAWKTEVFVVRIQRLPKFPRDARGWQRYRVVDAKSIHLADVLKEPMRESFQVTLKQGEAYHEENMKTGCVGTIMTFLECDSAGSRIQLVSWAGYGPDAYDEDDPCEDWKTVLVDAVEKASGRA